MEHFNSRGRNFLIYNIDKECTYQMCRLIITGVGLVHIFLVDYLLNYKRIGFSYL